MSVATLPELSEVTANLSVGKIRRGTYQGREHIIAPATLIVPGVLNGSKGSLYYPPEEVGRNPSIWDGTPILVNHPFKGGKSVAAKNNQEVLDAQGIGLLRKSNYGGKLRSEAWFDVEKTKKVDNRVYDNLIKGLPIELSTGLFTEDEPAPQGSNYRGKAYDYIARNYQPDHLAILPDKKGACSIQDGCGVLVNTQNATVENEKRTLLQKLGELLGIKTETKAVENATEPGAAEDASKRAQKASQNALTQKDHAKAARLHGKAAQANRDKAIEHQNQTNGYPLASAYGQMADQHVEMAKQHAMKACGVAYNINEEQKLVELEAAYNRDWPQSKRDKTSKKDFAGPDQSFPIETQADVDAASHLVGKAADPDAVKARIKSIAKRRGLSVPDSWTKENEEVETDGQTSGSSTTNSEGEPDMATKLNDVERKKIVDGLVTNCACKVANVFTEEDRETLNEMDDEKLRTLARQRQTLLETEPVLNAAREICGAPTLALNEMPAALKKAAKKGKKDAKGNGGDEEYDEEDETEGDKPNKNEATPEQWLKESNAPRAVRDAVRNAMNIEARERKDLIERITANIENDDDRKRLANRLAPKPLDELRDMALLVPAKNEDGTKKLDIPQYYYGVAPAQNASRGSVEDDEDVLEFPTTNWEQVSKENSSKKNRSA